MRNKLLTLAVLAGCLSLSVPGTATALPFTEESTGPVNCTFTVAMTFAFPPLPGAAVESESGAFDCTGQTVNGLPVTGPATYAMHGEYATVCAAGFSDGMGTVRFPTAGGAIIEVTGPYHLEWGPFAGHYVQEMGDKTFEGAFGGFPTTGGPCTGDFVPGGGRADIAGAGHMSS